MAARYSGRILRGLGYLSAAGVVGGGTLYFVYRPREVPGLESASVPPPTYGEGGVFRPPNFPRVKSRAEQIADLKASAGAAFQQAKSGNILGALGGAQDGQQATNGGSGGGGEDPYDLLVIGGG